MSKIPTKIALEAVAAQFFLDYPNRDEVFITEDGQPFFEENRAILHADNKDLSYQRWARNFQEITEQETKMIEPTANSPEYRGADPAEEKAKYEAKVKELQELELDNKNYPKMKSLVQYFGLEVEDMKASTLIVALEELKQKLSK